MKRLVVGLIVVLISVSCASSTTGPEGATSGASTPLASPSPGPSVKAPDVIGMTFKEANAAFQKNANAAGGDASVFLNAVHSYSAQPAGTVVSVSTPYGHRGALIPSGTTVTLTLAKPIPPVPNVVNMKSHTAEGKLTTMGYKVRTESQVSTKAKGLVLSQSVKPGKHPNPYHTTIMLTVAKPPPKPPTNQGQSGGDPSVAKVCNELHEMFVRAGQGTLTTNWARAQVRGWGDLQFQSNANLSGDAHLIYGDLYWNPPATLNVLTADLARMKNDCARAGAGF